MIHFGPVRNWSPSAITAFVMQLCSGCSIFHFPFTELQWSLMSPETTIQKTRRAPAATSVHHMISCVCSVLVLSIAVLVLVLEAIWYSNPAHWSASSREPPRSTIGIAAVQTAIEYEYGFTEYRFTEYRFAEYENVEIRCEAPTLG